MINFSLNTCWRLIPTAKSKGGYVFNHLCFFDIRHFTIFSLISHKISRNAFV